MLKWIAYVWVRNKSLIKSLNSWKVELGTQKARATTAATAPKEASATAPVLFSNSAARVSWIRDVGSLVVFSLPLTIGVLAPLYLYWMPVLIVYVLAAAGWEVSLVREAITAFAAFYASI